ncbi:serine protease [Saccharopolyspora shandongensis]|uniref:serine protease n=1 Tax=Saccharopolyspora shandongensis TaxID=418495 RepID=UPI0033F195F3
MRTRSAPLVSLIAVAVLAAGGFASAEPRWAASSTAAVHPGAQTVTNSAQCTSNFVFQNGSKVYLGQAAHCARTGGFEQTNGCTSPSLPIGTQVQVTGASKPGVLVYSSWLTMQALKEKDANACAYNDFALVQLDPADVGKVNPSLPVWGGPSGLNTGGLQQGDVVVTYGSSKLRAGASDLNAKAGTSLGDSGGGWNHTIFTVTPGIPGDSGSGVLDSSGRAVAVLSTLNISTQNFGSNGAGDLARELDYLHAHSSLRNISLVTGTQEFRTVW